MQHIHVRSVFQLYIPLSQDSNKNKFTITQLTGSNVGLTLHNKETNEYLQYDARLFSSCLDTGRKIEQDHSTALDWAKRNSYQLQYDGNMMGIILKLKIQHHVFDFRKVKKITIRFHLNCFNSGVLIGQATSSPILLLPKKRQANASDFSDETTIPMVWMQELQPIIEPAQNSTTINNQLSDVLLPIIDDSDQYIVPWNADLEAEPIHIGEFPTDDYAIQSYDYNSNTDEQYMVLYNGDAEVIGNFRALNFYKASDIRIKENIRLLSEDQDARDVLLKIDGVEYKFKNGVTSESQRRFVGFIAQQIEAVVPEAVQLIDGVLHVDYQSIIPYLSESIKQNFNDIKVGRSERDQIKATVDLLYEEYLIRENKKDRGDKRPQISNIESGSQKQSIRSRSILRILIYVFISAAIISSLAIGSIYVYNKYFAKSTPSSADPQPLTPSFNAATDRKALVQFYIATNGGSWNISTNWVTEAPMCQWYGISCSNYSRIIGINLDNNYVSGTLSESIGDLDQLKNLQLNTNYLTGTIPKLALQDLQVIDLSNNRLEFVAADLIQPVGLQQCNASMNSFKCPIPQWMIDSCHATCT